MCSSMLERVEHTGSAEDLCLEVALVAADGSNSGYELSDGDVTEARRSFPLAVPSGQ